MCCQLKSQVQQRPIIHNLFEIPKQMSLRIGQFESKVNLLSFNPKSWKYPECRADHFRARLLKVHKQKEKQFTFLLKKVSITTRYAPQTQDYKGGLPSGIKSEVHDVIKRMTASDESPGIGISQIMRQLPKYSRVSVISVMIFLQTQTCTGRDRRRAAFPSARGSRLPHILSGFCRRRRSLQRGSIQDSDRLATRTIQ